MGEEEREAEEERRSEEEEEDECDATAIFLIVDSVRVLALLLLVYRSACVHRCMMLTERMTTRGERKRRGEEGTRL